MPNRSHIIVASLGALAALVACGDNDDTAIAAGPLACSEAAAQVAAQPAALGLPAGTTLRVLSAETLDASSTLPRHCHIVGALNERTSAVDGKAYAVKFRLRMPTSWNGRFFMQGGGGSNGTLGDATGPLGGQQTSTALAQGFAVVATDSGHDNAVNSDPAWAGASAYGRDPQSRVDFGYRAYDLTTQAGKAVVGKFYGRAPDKSYFVGCSEGGREAALMSQRFPQHYDGIVAGAPAISLPYHASYAPYLLQTFVPLARAQGQIGADGVPLINKTYTDGDLQLVATAVLAACDARDGVVDGMVSNLAACTEAVVMPELDKMACTGAKTDACVTRAQITALQRAMGGPKTSAGVQLYAGNSWDPGIGGMNGSTFNGGFRSWWLGSYASATNNAIKVTLSTPQHAMVWRTPPAPLTAAQYIDYELNFNIDDTEALITATTPLYTESAKSYGLADSPDIDAYRARGGKMIVYHGSADSSHNHNDTARWVRAIDQRAGGRGAESVRYFIVPGMNHCSGGPGADRFDMLGPLVDWVERGQAPERITATASTPGYFGVAARSRPLCVYPAWARYNGSGDINDAANFSCVAP